MEPQVEDYVQLEEGSTPSASFRLRENDGEYKIDVQIHEGMTHMRGKVAVLVTNPTRQESLNVSLDEQGCGTLPIFIPKIATRTTGRKPQWFLRIRDEKAPAEGRTSMTG